MFSINPSSNHFSTMAFWDWADDALDAITEVGDHVLGKQTSNGGGSSSMQHGFIVPRDAAANYVETVEKEVSGNRRTVSDVTMRVEEPARRRRKPAVHAGWTAARRQSESSDHSYSPPSTPPPYVPAVGRLRRQAYKERVQLPGHRRVPTPPAPKMRLDKRLEAALQKHSESRSRTPRKEQLSKRNTREKEPVHEVNLSPDQIDRHFGDSTGMFPRTAELARKRYEKEQQRRITGEQERTAKRRML